VPLSAAERQRFVDRVAGFRRYRSYAETDEPLLKRLCAADEMQIRRVCRLTEHLSNDDFNYFLELLLNSACAHSELLATQERLQAHLAEINRAVELTIQLQKIPAVWTPPIELGSEAPIPPELENDDGEALNMLGLVMFLKNYLVEQQVGLAGEIEESAVS